MLERRPLAQPGATRVVIAALRVVVLLAWMALITYWSSQGSLPIDAPDVANLLHNL